MWLTRPHDRPRQELPPRLADADFWHMVREFSEPGGYFRSDNFVSNESSFQQVIPELLRVNDPGGVYLGVGPDQNFTYIVALRPRIAFLFDIRRQNLLELLLYKALIELSADRAEFLSRLFARPRAPALDSATTVQALFAALYRVPPDSALYRETLLAVDHHLIQRHGFDLSAEDLARIAYVYDAFFGAGPDLTYSFSSGRGGYAWRRMPTYGELMQETDAEGAERGYLATEQNFQILRRLQRDNLIVPLVGDFAGDKAIKAVAQYLKRRGLTVTAFYTSNVEQYLFRQGDDWRAFYNNVAALPIDRRSTFIRAVFNSFGLRYPPAGAGPRSVTLLAPIAEVLTAVGAGQVRSYYDLIQLSQ